MDPKPLYRRKLFWVLGAVMVTIVVVGGRYTWELVPSASYRELQREVYREREAQPAPEERVVYTDDPVADAPSQTEGDLIQDEEPVVSPGALDRWSHQFGASNYFHRYFHPSILEFETVYPYDHDLAAGNAGKSVYHYVQNTAMRRQYFLNNDDFSLDVLDEWAGQYSRGTLRTSQTFIPMLPWCIVRAIWTGNEELALLLLDRYLWEIADDPNFYGKVNLTESSRGHNLPYLMMVLDYCGIDNPKLWDRIGTMLETAEGKQHQVTAQFHEELLRDTEGLVGEIQNDRHSLVESPFSHFMNGFFVDAAQTIYTPIYLQKVRNFSGHFAQGNDKEALKELRGMEALQEKLFWKSNPGLKEFDRFGIFEMKSDEEQLAALELIRKNRESLMAITPREYATNVYTYLHEGTLADGLELHEVNSFTPIKISYYQSEEYGDIFRGLPGRIISLEEVPDHFSYGHIRKLFSENLSEKVTPGVALIQRREVPIHDTLILYNLAWRADDSEAFRSMLLNKPMFTLWYGELAIFPDLETIRGKLAPEAVPGELSKE